MVDQELQRRRVSTGQEVESSCTSQSNWRLAALTEVLRMRLVIYSLVHDADSWLRVLGRGPRYAYAVLQASHRN